MPVDGFPVSRVAFKCATRRTSIAFRINHFPLAGKTSAANSLRDYFCGVFIPGIKVHFAAISAKNKDGTSRDVKMREKDRARERGRSSGWARQREKNHIQVINENENLYISPFRDVMRFVRARSDSINVSISFGLTF